jgi:CRP/FNR family transcriptional regulator/CRP/FNR family cyclic AMP-dependent transcriptional regulator
LASRAPTNDLEAFLRPLAHTDLFGDFTTTELATLAGWARPRAFREGQVIFHRDDPGTGLFVVRTGLVKISIVAPDGQESLANLLGPGEYFGEMAIMDGLPRSATATAMSRTETIYLAREGFLRFLDQHPGAMKKIIVVLSQRLRAATEHMADLVFHDVYGRLAKKLLELGESQGRAHPDGRVEILLSLTQQDLANLVGASRESVNKVLKLYRDKGYVSVQSHRITLLQPRELQRRAELG